MKSNEIKRRATRSLAVVALVALGVVSAAAQDHTGHTGHGQMAGMPHELHYIDMTIMHHEQGIEMARLAQQKGTDARVKTFAKKTGDDQQRDLLALRGHRQHWYSDRPQMNHAQMMAHMQSMPGHQNMKMDMEGDFRKLQAAEGREFDRLFLDTMIHHHKMAVDMSKEAATKAEHAEIRDFARKAVAKQQSEIGEMNRINAAFRGVRPATKTAARKPAPKKKPAAKKPAAHTGHGNH